MKVKVINEFVDVHTGVLHEKGSTFDCTEARFREIKRAGHFVKPYEAKKENKPAK